MDKTDKLLKKIVAFILVCNFSLTAFANVKEDDRKDSGSQLESEVNVPKMNYGFFNAFKAVTNPLIFNTEN